MEIDPAAWSREVPGALRRFRLRTALPQAEVAKRADLATSTLSSWERGHASPHLDGLLRLLAVLRVDLGELQREVQEGVRMNQEGAEGTSRGPHTGRVSVIDRRMAKTRGDARPPRTGGTGARGAHSLREGGMMVWWAVEEMDRSGQSDEERFENALENLRDAVHRQLLQSWVRHTPEEDPDLARDDGDEVEERSEAS